MSQAETRIGESPAYWTHSVDAFPSPVAQFRMAQLIDLDDRLYETARIVYRFLVGWYHDDHGDALLSQRHVAKVMKQRAPAGATVPSRNAVQRAIIALMGTGWVVRTFQGRGKGKGASRYVPVVNVLELAAQGKFPEPTHATGPVEPAHANGPLVARANGPVDAEPTHATGPKTLLPDPATEPGTGKEDNDCAAPAHGLAASASAQGGFEELYRTYDVRSEYVAARAAYQKLGPEPELHAEMVAAAKAWKDAAGGIERMHLARWIKEERFREDPKGKQRRDRPAKEAPPVDADNDDAPRVPRRQKDARPKRPASGLSGKHLPFGTHDAVIFATDFENRGDQDFKLHLDFRVVGGEEDGLEFRHTLPIVSMDEDEAVKANRQLADICRANDFVGPLEDSSDLRGFFVSIRKTATTGVEYARSAANNEMGVAA